MIKFWLPALLLIVAIFYRVALADEQPIELYYQPYTSETADTNILDEDIRISHHGCLRIGFAGAGIPSIMVNGQKIVLNNGDALGASTGYTGVWPVRPGQRINFQGSSTNSIAIHVQMSRSDAP